MDSEEEADVFSDKSPQRAEQEEDARIFNAWMQRYRGGVRQNDPGEEEEGRRPESSLSPPFRARTDRRASLPCPATLSSMQLSLGAPVTARILLHRSSSRCLLPAPQEAPPPERRPSLRSTIPEAPPPERRPSLITTIPEALPPERRPSLITTIPEAPPPERRPSLRSTIPEALPPERRPSLRSTIPEALPPERRPSLITTIPEALPPERRPSLRSTIPEAAAPERRSQFRRRNTMSLSDAYSVCLICHNELNRGSKGTRELQCSHTFHRKCIEAWLWRKQSCPKCHASAGPLELHQCQIPLRDR